MGIYQLLIIVIIFNFSECLGVQSKHESPVQPVYIKHLQKVVSGKIRKIRYMDNSS